MPNLTAIHAARGGIVGQVVEGNSKQDHPTNPWDDGNKPNILRIDHQDGTASWYYHMVQGGVVPAVGDRVHRGEVVGWVGTTGRSTGPHLHIQAGSVYGKSALVRFEAKLVYGPLPCYVPTKGMALVSTNVKP